MLGRNDFISLEQDRLESVALAIGEETDGKALKRDLGENLKAAVEPALPIIRGEIMAMGGAITSDPPLRTTVVNQMTTKVRYSGAAPGVRVAISRKGMPRGFTDAARRINQGQWAHPVFNRPDSDTIQIGKLDFFDGPLQDRKEEMRQAVLLAIEEMSDRIARRSG